ITSPNNLSSLSSCTYLHFLLIKLPPSAFYPLSLHDALPIFRERTVSCSFQNRPGSALPNRETDPDLPVNLRPDRPGQFGPRPTRSEEHTSELQSRSDLVCRLLLEKKKENETKQ